MNKVVCTFCSMRFDRQEDCCPACGGTNSFQHVKQVEIVKRKIERPVVEVKAKSGLEIFLTWWLIANGISWFILCIIGVLLWTY